MVNAQSDRASYYYAQEYTGIASPVGTWGTTPTNPVMYELPIRDESLGFEPSTVEDPTLDSSGEVLDLILVNQRAAGGIDAPLRFASFDNQFANALRAHSGSGVGWSAEIIEAAGGSATISSNVVTFVGATFVTDGYTVGHWVKMTGWDTAANNTFGKISALTETTLTLTHCTLTDQGSGETDVSIEYGSYIENGTTLGSEVIVRRYEDLAADAPTAAFNGMTPDTVSLTIAAGALAELSIGYVGSAETSSDSSTFIASGSWNNGHGHGNAPLNCTSQVVNINVGDASYPVKTMTLNINNGLRAREQVGTLGAASMGLGKCRVTLDVEAYYTGNTEYANFLAQTATHAWWAMQDVDGDEYLFEISEGKWSNFTRTNSGTGTDIMASATLTGIADATEPGGKTIRITKWTA
jgi:hypothetical protein